MVKDKIDFRDTLLFGKTVETETIQFDSVNFNSIKLQMILYQYSQKILKTYIVAGIKKRRI